MFCSKCGKALSEGVRFCSGCGAPVISAAPDENTQTAENILKQTESAQNTTDINNTPAENAQNTAGLNSIPFEASRQPAAPVYPEAQSPQKKKSKAGLIAGISAAAVVVGGAGIGYTVFRNDIQRAFMGDAGYAVMIEEKADAAAEEEISENSSEDRENEIDKAITNSINSAISAISLNSSSSVSDIISNSESITEAASALTDPETASAAYRSGLQSISEDMLSEYNWKQIVSNSLEILPEGTGIHATFNVKPEPGELIKAADDGKTEAVSDFIGGLDFEAILTNSSTDRAAFGVSDKNGDIGTAELYSDANGLAIAFPGITDKVIFIENSKMSEITEIEEIGEIKEAGSAIAEEIKDIPQIDQAEVSRIRKDIKQLYYDAYDTADINYTDETAAYIMTFDGRKAEVSGTAVEVTFTAEQLGELANNIFDYLKNDEYLMKFVGEAFGTSREDYKAAFEKGSENKASLKLTNIIDDEQNIISRDVLITDTEKGGTVDLRYVKAEDKAAFEMSVSSDGKKASVSVYHAKTSDNSGEINLRADIDDKKSATLDIDMTYSDIAKGEWLGHEIGTGKFTVKRGAGDTSFDLLSEYIEEYTDSTEIPDMAKNYISTEQTEKSKKLLKALIGELKNAQLTAESSINDGTFTEKLSLSVGSIGKISFTQSASPSSEKPVMPDSSKAFDFNDEKDSKELMLDVLKWIKNVATRDEQISELYYSTFGAMLDEELAQGENALKMYEHYADYDKYSTELAQEYAQDICDMLVGTVTGHVTSTGKASGVIRLYYDKDGKCEIIDDAGIEDIITDGADIRSAYVEVLFDSRVSEKIAGATVVLTDSKNDIPKKLPDIYSYADGVFEWYDITDADMGYLGSYLYGGVIDNYVVGTFPELEYGVPSSTESSLEKGVSANTGSLPEAIYGTWALSSLKTGDYTIDLDSPLIDQFFSAFGGDFGITVIINKDDTIKMIYSSNDDEDSVEAGLIYRNGNIYLTDENGEVIDGQKILFDGKESLIIDAEDGSSTLIFKRTGDAPEQPEKKETVSTEIEDITGVWTDGDTSYSISSNYVFSATVNDEYYYMFLNPSEKGFNIFDQNIDRIGELSYDPDNDTLNVRDTYSGEERIMTREENEPYYSYFGEWKLTKINGQSPEEYGKENDLPGDSLSENVNVYAYDILIMSSGAPNIVEPVVKLMNDRFYVNVYSGENTERQLWKYDSTADTLTVTVDLTGYEGAGADMKWVYTYERGR